MFLYTVYTNALSTPTFSSGTSCGSSSLSDVAEERRGEAHWRLAFTRYCFTLKVLCSYELTAMVKFALLMYMSEFRLRVSSF